MDNNLDLERAHKPLTNVPKRDVMSYVIDGMAGNPIPRHPPAQVWTDSETVCREAINLRWRAGFIPLGVCTA